MEEKKTQIKQYLRNTVTPFLTPLMQAMVKEKPTDLAQFTYTYVTKLIQIKKEQQISYDTDQSSDEEDKEQIDKKFKMKLQENKKKNRNSRQGISAEVYGKFNKRESFIAKHVQKDQNTYNSITDLVKKSILFKSLSEKDISKLVGAMTIQECKSGTKIIMQKEKGQTLYIVGSGKYVCTKVINGKQVYLKTYQQGENFGELALMYNAPRAATITCSQQGTLYGLDRLTFKNIVQDAANCRRQKFRQILSKISILSEIDPYQREQLCDILKEEQYSFGNFIVKQGEEGDKFYMIVEGKLIAEKNNKKVFQFGEGDYFGEIALVRDMPRQASVKCVSQDCKVVSIERDAFKRMFGPIEQILKRNQEKYKQYIAS